MRMQHGGAILWMELGSDIPAFIRNLYDFHEVGCWVDAHAFHARLLIFRFVGIVELIAMAMTFLGKKTLSLLSNDGESLAIARKLCAFLPSLTGGVGGVCLVRLATLHQFTFVRTQSHGASHLGDVLLLLHDVDDVVWRLRIHLTAVGILVAQHVAGKFDDHHLHTQTDAEGGNIMSAGVFGGNDFSFNTAQAEPWANHDALQAIQLLGYILHG